MSMISIFNFIKFSLKIIPTPILDDKKCIFVKLRQGSGKDRRGMVIKWPVNAPERP